jgi:hypothetical protein
MAFSREEEDTNYFKFVGSEDVKDSELLLYHVDISNRGS